MATFILVHGAWQASWCWRLVQPLLNARGHRVLAVDLPGHGNDANRASTVTFQDYVDSVGRTVAGCERRPILVVHSWGGLGCAAAETWPGRLSALVLIAGAVPPSGASMMHVVEQYDPDFRATFFFSADRRLAGITSDGARAFLYNRAPASEVDDAIHRLTLEPVAPFEAPVVMTPGRFGLVRRFYVETLADRAVPLRLQKMACREIGVQRIFSLDADHCPFFSAPEALVSCLHDVAAESRSSQP